MSVGRQVGAFFAAKLPKSEIKQLQLETGSPKRDTSGFSNLHPGRATSASGQDKDGQRPDEFGQDMLVAILTAPRTLTMLLQLIASLGPASMTALIGPLLSMCLAMAACLCLSTNVENTADGRRGHHGGIAAEE
jgi:hypothetical protein